MIRGSPDPFPIFEGGVRLRQTRSKLTIRAVMAVYNKDDEIAVCGLPDSYGPPWIPLPL